MATGDVKAFRENSGGSFDEIKLTSSTLPENSDALELKANKRVSILTKTDSFTLDVRDAGCYIRVNKKTAATVTIPYSAITEYFEAGDSIEIEQAGDGEVRMSMTAGGTLYGDVKTAGQYKTVRLLCIATDIYVVKDGVA